METQLVVLACAFQHLRMRRKRNAAVFEHKKRLQERRRRQFYRFQARERILFTLALSLIMTTAIRTPKSIWSKSRSNNWWEEIVNNTFTERDWLENFRMSHATYLYVCEQLRSSVKKKDTTMRTSIHYKKRVAITLWYLSTGSDFRTIGHLFGVSKSAVSIIVQEVCAAITEKLLPTNIQFPTGEKLQQTVDGFMDRYGFPQCFGVVDGSHIPIVSPQYFPADYYNRKGWHSVILQGTVNHLGQFIDVNVGWPGRVHDARVFSNSKIFELGQTGKLVPDRAKTITAASSQKVPLCILGDPAYPLLPWVMKAFPDNGRLTRQQKTFNYRLCRARVIVEHTYGRLKGRWRCLRKQLDVDVYRVPELVAACCTLHNICEVHGDGFNDEWMDGTTEQTTQDSTNSATASTPSIAGESERIRETLMAYFVQNPLREPDV